MPETPDPLVAWRRLRIELRRLREAKGDTQQQVADAMEWSLSKLIRIETGRIRISTNDLKVLTGYYGLPDERREELLTLSRDSRRQAWWEPYRDYILPEYASFVACESDASEIRSFEPNIIPGLLQTRAYTDAVFANFGLSGERAAKQAELRMERQRLFDKADAPAVWFVIDESAIRRQVGGPDLMRDQLRHVRDMAARPGVEIRIAPFSMGLYPWHREGYAVLRFADDSPMILYTSSASGQMLTSDVRDDRPQLHLEAFDALRTRLSGEESAKIVDDALGRLR